MSEIDELISRSLEGRINEAGSARLQAWREHSPGNEAHYREATRLVRRVAAALTLSDVPPPPPVRSLIARARRARPRWAPRSELGRISSGAMAAAGAGLAAAAVVALALWTGPASPEFSFGKGEFVTGGAETATVVLGDATIVRLGPNSRLRIPGNQGSREVELEGQAFFAVAELPGYPFRVRTEAGEARVLGTRFELRTSDRDLRLVVLEGKVALASATEELEVEAGEISFITEGRTSSAIRVDDARTLVPWLERFLVFQATPLREVARELESQYGRRVEISDVVLEDLTVTGWYADKSFEEVVAIVCGVLRADCSISEGVTRISAGPHSNRVPLSRPRPQSPTPTAEDR
jgi:transmembrane sensor